MSELKRREFLAGSLAAFCAFRLEAEAGALRLEILAAARGGAVKTQAQALVERWPGLEWRVRDIEAGRGRLPILRRTCGVERDDPPKDRPRPY